MHSFRPALFVFFSFFVVINGQSKQFFMIFFNARLNDSFELSATTSTTSTTTTTTAGAFCGNTQLDQSVRQRFFEKHNLLRGSLARGQTERNGDLGIAPPAANMYRMRYSCDAESYAQQHANTCDQRVLPPSGRPGYKENIYSFRGSGSQADAAEAATNNWWSQLARNGMRSDMLFTSAVRHRETRRVTKWSKMAWWNNLEVGCAINSCNGFQFVVCMYRPGGNNVGDYVYNVGAV
ncbi:SCP domain-containing protein, partial [Trichostrongylus colubriformis]